MQVRTETCFDPRTEEPHVCPGRCACYPNHGCRSGCACTSCGHGREIHLEELMQYLRDHPRQEG